MDLKELATDRLQWKFKRLYVPLMVAPFCFFLIIFKATRLIMHYEVSFSLISKNYPVFIMVWANARMVVHPISLDNLSSDMYFSQISTWYGKWGSDNESGCISKSQYSNLSDHIRSMFLDTAMSFSQIL